MAPSTPRMQGSFLSSFVIARLVRAIHNAAMKQGYVYIMASKPNGTLYTGVTSDLIKRVYEHKNKMIKGFTSKYDVHTLVYYECADSIETAISREKRIKKYPRQWKINLIQGMNPVWRDLYDEICGLPEQVGQ